LVIKGEQFQSEKAPVRTVLILLVNRQAFYSIIFIYHQLLKNLCTLQGFYILRELVYYLKTNKTQLNELGLESEKLLRNDMEYAGVIYLKEIVLH